MFGGGSLDDALALLDDFDAVMDEPWMLMYEEVMTAFPDSKHLDTVQVTFGYGKRVGTLVKERAAQLT